MIHRHGPDKTTIFFAGRILTRRFSGANGKRERETESQLTRYMRGPASFREELRGRISTSCWWSSGVKERRSTLILQCDNAKAVYFATSKIILVFQSSMSLLVENMKYIHGMQWEIPLESKMFS